MSTSTKQILPPNIRFNSKNRTNYTHYSNTRPITVDKDDDKDYENLSRHHVPTVQRRRCDNDTSTVHMTILGNLQYFRRLNRVHEIHYQGMSKHHNIQASERTRHTKQNSARIQNRPHSYCSNSRHSKNSQKQQNSSHHRWSSVNMEGIDPQT